MGNFLVLNLFLALLLNSFSCEELKSRKEVSPINFDCLKSALIQLGSMVNVDIGN